MSQIGRGNWAQNICCCIECRFCFFVTPQFLQCLRMQVRSFRHHRELGTKFLKKCRCFFGLVVIEQSGRFSQTR